MVVGGAGPGNGKGGLRGAGALPMSITVTPGHMGEQSPPPSAASQCPTRHRPETQAVTQTHAVLHTLLSTETRAQHTMSHAVPHRACSLCSFGCTIYGHTQGAWSTPTGRLTHRTHGTRPRAWAPALTWHNRRDTVPGTLCQPHTHQVTSQTPSVSPLAVCPHANGPGVSGSPALLSTGLGTEHRGSKNGCRLSKCTA